MAINTSSNSSRTVLGSLENTSYSIDYHWYGSDDPLKEKQEKTERRRNQMLEAMHSEDKTFSVTEWLALQTERDRLLQMSVQQENESNKQEFVKELRQVLYDIPSFSRTKEDQDMFHSITDLKGRLTKYSRVNNIKSPPPLPINHRAARLMGQEGEEETDGGIIAPPPPPPPPPPPLPPLSLSPPPSPCHKEKTTTIAPAPLKKADFISELNGDKKHLLKRVNIPRTPGGTPRRPRHRVNINEDSCCHGDLIQRALLRKFHNVRVHSTPRGYCPSPGIGESGGSMEASSAWSDKHYASDPDLTSVGTGPALTDTHYTYRDPSISSPFLVLSPMTAQQEEEGEESVADAHRSNWQYSVSA